MVSVRGLCSLLVSTEVVELLLDNGEGEQYVVKCSIFQLIRV